MFWEEPESCEGENGPATHTAPEPQPERLQVFPEGVHVLLDLWVLALSLGHHLLQVKLDHLRQGLATQVTLRAGAGGGDWEGGLRLPLERTALSPGSFQPPPPGAEPVVTFWLAMC